MEITNDCSRRIGRTLALDFIAASGAQPADNVTIAGTAHLDILIELMRRGFSRVLCRSADFGPHLAIPPADILMAPVVRNDSDLRNIVTRLGRDLGPRGVLVVQPCFSYDERRLRRLLMEGGFMVVERIGARGDVGTLWCARKAVAAMRRAA